MSKIKNIAQFSVHGYFDPEPILGRTDTGGQVTYVLELSKYLAQINDIKVDIYTRQFGDRETVAPVNDRVRVVRLPCGPNEFIRKEDMFPYWDEFTDNAEAYFKENGLHYEVLHGHYWDAGYVCMNLAERFGQPYFYTAHSLGAWKREQMGGDPAEMERLFKFEERIHWENILFRKAAAHTVTTVDGKENYKRLYEFETPHMDVIPPGVDIHRFRPLEPGEKDRDLHTPDKYVFCLSRIDSNKGHAELIRAFSHVVEEVPDAYLLIGGGSKEPKQHEIDVRNSFVKVVDERGLGDRVVFTGYVDDDDLATYYRKAQLFVLPSKYEPFGMTTLEAMSCGTPVVATKFGGIRNNLKNEYDALMVDPTDEREFGTAMTRLLTDEALSRKLVANGLVTIRDRFSWEAIAATTLKFYERYV
ncbi:MAG: glycosyltransferase [Candidatus Latescibacterota bacterium]|jgi:mannosylfructose-phosphate synthase